MIQITKERIKAAAAIAGGLAGSYVAHRQGARISFVESQAIGGLGTLCGYVAGSLLTHTKKKLAKAKR